MTISLPAGWVAIKWADIGSCQNGRAFPSADYTDDGVRLLRPGNLHESGRIEWTEKNTRHLPAKYGTEFPEYLVGPRELVMNLTAQSLKDEFLGRACITGEEEHCLLNQRIARLTPTGTLPEFCLWLFKSPLFRRYVDGGLNAGSLIQHIYSSQIDEFSFGLPPVTEQRRIVAKLEALQARSRRARAALDAVPPLLERLRQSILAAAFRGDLTKDWRAKHKDVEPATELLKRIRTERRNKWEQTELARLNANGKPPTDDKWKARYKEPEPIDTTGLPELAPAWCWASVDEISWSHDSRRVPVKLDDRSSRSGPYPYYGAFGIIDHVDDFIFDTALVLIAEDGKNLMDRKRPISLVAAGKYWVNNHAHVLEPMGSLPHRYLSEYFNSVDLRPRLTGIDQVKLTARALATLPVPLAPEAEQPQVARVVAAGLARIASLRALLEALLIGVAHQDAACLASAFRGDLVPQDPNDEPAEAMLARLREGNGAAATATKRATRRARKHS